MPDESARYNRVAVFIDVDNLVISADNMGLPVALGPIINRIREEGQIVFVRAYGDWAQPHISRYLDEFRRHTIEMTQLSTSATGKNTADVHLAVEALEMTLLPSAPDTIVIISGDRDFVPLVQKIKRYGKTVLGIGIQGSTSNDLAMACNAFLFADEILGGYLPVPDTAPAPASEPTSATSSVEDVAPKTPAQSEPPPLPVADPVLDSRQRRAFALLARSVASIVRQGSQAYGSNVLPRMQQLDPTFYPERFGFRSFKDFVLVAHSAGYVRVKMPKQGDFHFEGSFSPPAELLDVPLSDEFGEDRAPELDFGSPEAACKSYRLILQRYKRLELVPWEKRQELVRHLWKVLEKSSERSGGMPLADLVEELRTYALNSRCWVEDKAMELIVRTICIAQCFESDEGVPHFHNMSLRVRPAVDVGEAIFNMHYTYVNGIKLSLPGVPLDADAVALLLFDELTNDTRDQAARVIERVSGGTGSYSNRMADAFKRAKGSSPA